MIVREIGRILISLCLIGLATCLLYLGFNMPDPAQGLGISSIAGAIIGSLLTYWLKPG